jgi:hypothetical protein
MINPNRKPLHLSLLSPIDVYKINLKNLFKKYFFFTIWKPQQGHKLKSSSSVILSGFFSFETLIAYYIIIFNWVNFFLSFFLSNIFLLHDFLPNPNQEVSLTNCRYLHVKKILPFQFFFSIISEPRSDYRLYVFQHHPNFD